MTTLSRGALCCALVLAATGAAARGVPAPQALYLPAELANVCEADQQALQQAISRHWQPALSALDQWAQLVRSFSCDLSGSKDLGWHRVPLRAYESAIRYPLTLSEVEVRNGRKRRTVKTYWSAAQLPAKIDFWVGGRIDEIRYDKRQRRLEARFTAAGSRVAASGANNGTMPCAVTTLQFRQQNGLWLLSGIEPDNAPRC